MSAAAIEGDRLHIEWADGHHSTFQLDELLRWHRSPERNDPARLPRRPWRAGSEDRWARFDAVDLASDVGTQRRWAEALIVDGIAIVEGMADTDAALTQLARLGGEVRPSVAGAYFDVRIHDELVSPWYVYDDGRLGWLAFEGGNFHAANRAYSDYLQANYPDEYAEACNPSAYASNSVHLDSALALIEECANLTIPVAGEVADWVEAGKPGS